MEPQNNIPQNSVANSPAPTPQMPQPNNNPASPAPLGESPSSSIGPIVGSVIVVLVIVLGGLYLYGSQRNDTAVNQNENGPSAEDIVTAPDQTTAALQAQGSTDSIDEIDADLKATDLNSLDADTGNVSNSLEVQ